ncbi:MAG: ABC transporter permease [Rhodothermales bacterium]
MRAIFLEIWEALMTALRAIGMHKMRSVLTTLGIVIGIASVTAMATVINGIERYFDQSMAELGSDVLYVEKWPWVSGPGSKWWEFMNRPEIKPELADVINERANRVTAAAPVVGTSRPVSYEGNTITPVYIEASTAEFLRVHVVELELGRFYSELDDRAGRNVAVIGAQVADMLFPQESPLGKSVRIGNHRFQVIGVLKRKGTGSDQQSGADQQARIPLNTFDKVFGLRDRGVSVQARVVATSSLEAAKDELTGILRTARQLDARDQNNFEINEHESLRKSMAPVKTAIYGIGIFLTALSLLVGGIGVMNIMFVSVKERTHEIGLRKAVGARRRTILTQFLIEAIIVCLIGGVIGVLLASGLAAIINMFFTAYLPVETVVVAFVICVLVGVSFGLAPAWSAAKADPIESLRYE